MQRSHCVAPPKDRPQATYYHNGIGGRGNYHKYNHEEVLKNRRSVFTRSITAVFGGGSGTFRHTSGSPLMDEFGGLKRRQFSRSYFSSRWFNFMGCFGAQKACCQHPPTSNMSCATLTSEKGI